jgi:hypothetical protein
VDGINGASLVQTSRTLTAGNGLTGGGDLSANRTLTLGTPSDITNSTTNSVTSTSHTHALGIIAAEVSTTTSASTTSFGLGHIIMCSDSAQHARNSAIVPTLYTGNTSQYISDDLGGAGTALTGTWRCRGYATSNIALLQRVA